MKYNLMQVLQSAANVVYNVVFSSYPRMIFWSAVYALIILIVKGN